MRWLESKHNLFSPTRCDGGAPRQPTGKKASGNEDVSLGRVSHLPWPQFAIFYSHYLNCLRWGRRQQRAIEKPVQAAATSGGKTNSANVSGANTRKKNQQSRKGTPSQLAFSRASPRVPGRNTATDTTDGASSLVSGLQQTKDRVGGSLRRRASSVLVCLSLRARSVHSPPILRGRSYQGPRP